MTLICGFGPRPHARGAILTALALVAAGVPAAAGATDAASTARCLAAINPDAPPERASECMSMGRHVRVDASVSRGAASLGPQNEDGLLPAAAGRMRVRATQPVGGFMSSGFFGR